MTYDYDPFKFPFNPTAAMVAQSVMDDAFGDFGVTPVKATVNGQLAWFSADLTGDFEYEVTVRRVRAPKRA
jgi:hypothetical protein